MENTQIKLSETVMVIDVAYLNFVINDLRKYFEPLLGRSLQTVDLALFTMYLKASLGEFSFMAVPSEGFVSRGDLYLDLLQIVLNAAEVKKLIVVPFNEEYGKEVENVLRECALENAGHKEEAKDIVYFRMEEPAAPAVCRWEMLGYPLMSVLGIRSEDLQNN